MYSLTQAPSDNIVRLKFSGKISGKEYREICVSLRRALDQNQNISLLCELDDFRGVGPVALWRAALVATENRTNFRRVAVVGERSSYKWARALVRGFHAETRYFDQAHRTRAIGWLVKPTEHGATASGIGILGDAAYRGTTIQPRRKKR
jgi:predicted N-acetyltransferase YhbS